MHDPDATLTLWDYRRRVVDAYREVREVGGGSDAWRRWRAARDELFHEHPQSALEPEDRPHFGGLPFFDYDPGWAVEGRVHEVDDVETFEVAHSGDGTTTFRRFATVRFVHDGTEHELAMFWLDAYGGGVFLPFRDATSGEQTYGGGRYLLDTAKGADLGGSDRTVHLDFNFAYHPSCVHSARWSCPLAPPENRLDVAVRAGEQLPDHHG